uniref:Glucagon n=1 Tax=Amazona collaria TaxID=241587 RepID=A0A8B9FE27_9PSIT
MSFKVLSLLLVSLGFVLMDETVSGISVGTPSTRPLQRRYSEATLASDYSLQTSIMMEPYKRAAEPQGSAASGQRLDLGTQEAKDFFSWLLKGNKTQSSASLEGAGGLKDVLTQELLAWLMSTDLCRAT